MKPHKYSLFCKPTVCKIDSRRFGSTEGSDDMVEEKLSHNLLHFIYFNADLSRF